MCESVVYRLSAVMNKKLTCFLFFSLEILSTEAARVLGTLTTSLGDTVALVFSVLDSGSKGPGSSPGRVIVLHSWARHFTVPPSTQEYKWDWVLANCQGNLTKCWEATCDRLVSHPIGEAILLVASCYRNRDKLRQAWATRLVRLNLTTSLN